MTSPRTARSQRARSFERGVRVGRAGLLALLLGACGGTSADDGHAPLGAGAMAAGNGGAAATAQGGSSGSLSMPTAGQGGGAAAGRGGQDQAGASGGVGGPATDAGGVADAGTTSEGDAAVPMTPAGTPALFWLDIGANSVNRGDPDGREQHTIATGMGLTAPDGVSVDAEGGHVYVINMGSLLGGAGNASLVRMDLDGSNAETLIAPGTRDAVHDEVFNTGKQVTLDAVNHQLYWGDREGAKVWRSNLDGSALEILVMGHGLKQVVGVAVDPGERQFYFTDRNDKKIYRASMDMPAGMDAETRDDLELLVVDGAANAMPIDLEIDLVRRQLYWTDRQQDTVFRIGLTLPQGESAQDRSDVAAVATDLNDVIGIALDDVAGVLFVTHSGTVTRFDLDGSARRAIGDGGTTGIAFARIP